jgi:hypothetical protein
VTKWHPIETAPRDRTEIILYFKSEQTMVLAYWREAFKSDPEGYQDDSWWSDKGYSGLCDDGSKPTHWMPLPEAPDHMDKVIKEASETVKNWPEASQFLEEGIDEMNKEIMKVDEKPPVALECLRIARKGWGEYGYGGKVEFKGKKCEVAIIIDDKLCRKIIELCADQLVDTARDVAENLKADLLTIEVIND